MAASAPAADEIVPVQCLAGEQTRPSLSRTQDDNGSRQEPIETNSATTEKTLPGRPYSSFSPWQKWFLVVFSALGGIFSGISTNIYVPAIPILSTAFGTTTEKIDLTVTLYLVFQALTPSIFGSAGDCFGHSHHRPIMILCLTIYLLSCIGSALCPTNAYWLLMILRIVQASGGSPMIAVGTGVVSDIATPQERGKYVGMFTLGSTMGPTVGPVLGGVLTYTLGWRAIFWFLVIFCACVLVPMIIARSWATAQSHLRYSTAPRQRTVKDGGRKESVPRRAERWFMYNPWSSFLLLLKPQLALMFAWASLYYGIWYALITIFSTLLKTEYGCNEIIIGLCYIPNGAGCAASSYLTGRIMDMIYKREERRVGGDHRAREDFDLEKVRISILPFHVFVLLGSIMGLAWSMKAHAPLAVPVILNFFVGLGTGFLTTVTIFGIDNAPGKGGAVTASFNLVRCAMGAVTVSTVQLIVDRMGAGWCFVLLSGVCLAGSPMLWVVWMYGGEWRREGRVLWVRGK